MDQPPVNPLTPWEEVLIMGLPPLVIVFVLSQWPNFGFWNWVTLVGIGAVLMLFALEN